MDEKGDIIKQAGGKSVVVINDLPSKGKRSVNWNKVEECLKEYIGQCAEITETSDVVYISAKSNKLETEYYDIWNEMQ